MCYVNNTIGNIHKIFNIIVQSEPKFTDQENSEQNIAVKMHHGVNLNCKVNGTPEPIVKWNFVSQNIFFFLQSYLHSLSNNFRMEPKYHQLTRTFIFLMKIKLSELLTRRRVIKGSSCALQRTI